jgi:hypothetical protein
VFGVIAPAVGGVEGGARKTGVVRTGVDDMGEEGVDAGARMGTSAAAFCFTVTIEPLLSLDLKLREFRPVSGDFVSGCNFYKQSQWKSLVTMRKMYLA